MINWKTVQAKFKKIDEQGRERVVTEHYLTDAMSATEAEAVVIKEIATYVTEMQVKSIKDTNYTDVFPSEDGDTFYKAVVAFVTLDEHRGVERIAKNNMLVQASDFDTALKNLNKGLEGMIVDYRIVSIAESNIVEVLDYVITEDATVEHEA